MATKIQAIYFTRSLDMGKIGGGHATYVMNGAVGGVVAERGNLDGTPGYVIKNVNVAGKPEMFLGDTSGTVSHVLYEPAPKSEAKK